MNREPCLVGVPNRPEQNAANEETTYTNDGNGQRTAMIRPNGASFEWRYDYDTADRLERVTDPLGHFWNYGYDAGDHRTSIRDANGHETTFTFDELGRQATHTYPGGATWTYAYDGNGNRTRADSPNGVTMSSTYDALNRLLLTTYSPSGPGGVSETTQRYDGNGNLVRIADAVGSGERAIARTYDDRDRLKSETDAFGRVLRYDYDNADNRTRRSDDADGVQTAWGYDERNRNDSVTDDSGTTRMSHYRDSRLREIVRPSGTTSAYTYDGAGRSATITHARAGAAIAEVRYEYDDNGNRTLERLANGGPERVTTYTYDRADRLATTAVAGGESVAYTLDPVGNRLGETRTGTSTTTITQVFNARDQVQTRTLSGATTGTTTYAWDANGNQISETEATDVTTNTWDARDRLVGIARTGEPDLTYVYNPEGLRIEAGDGSTGARFRYDAGHLYSEANGANQTVRRYRTNISGPAQKGWLQAAAATLTLFLGMTDAGAIPVERNYLHDALTTPIAIERSDGALAQRSSYDAWGNVESEQVIDAELNTKPNRIGFTGYQLDHATSEQGDTSYYAKARHYSAGGASFSSVDSYAGEPDHPITAGKYLYGNANPAVYVDPTGRYGVFFDGTRNDKNNPDFGPRTNVAKLFGLYNSSVESGKDYLPGVGTQASDMWLGSFAGFGSSKRVEQAYENLVRFYNSPAAREMRANDPAAWESERQIDVFGFSRGSMEARLFANVVRNRGIPNYEAPVTQKVLSGYGSNIKVVESVAYKRFEDVDVRFLGLFDTVDSRGLPGAGLLHDELKVDPSFVRHTTHLVASHEYRRGFPVVSVLPAPGVLLPNVEEIYVPGAHADVGGGYADLELEGPLMKTPRKTGLDKFSLAIMWDAAHDAAVPLDLPRAEDRRGIDPTRVSDRALAPYIHDSRTESSGALDWLTNRQSRWIDYGLGNQEVVDANELSSRWRSQRGLAERVLEHDVDGQKPR